MVEFTFADNQRRHAGADGSICFEVGNIATTPLPAMDLVMARDVFIDQPLALIRKSLGNAIKRDAKFALLRSYSRHMRDNVDAEDSNWRPSILQIAPFDLPQPELWVDEQCPEAGGAFVN